MRKAIITIGIISMTLLLLLFAIACSKQEIITVNNETTNTENNVQATDPTSSVPTSISSDISKIDSLSSELDNADLQNIDAEIAEIDW